MNTMTVQAAEALARRAHDRQVDKVGMPYFETHVQDVHRRVVAAGGSEDQQVAALLHDVLEDTDVTETDLRAADISEPALQLVLLMTKQDGEDTAVYLERIRDHESARLIKLADIAINTDPVRLARVDPDRRRKLLAKYAAYLEALNADALRLRQALEDVPASETPDERQMRLDRVLDERMAARLDELVEEDSFTTHEQYKQQRDGS